MHPEVRSGSIEPARRRRRPARATIASRERPDAAPAGALATPAAAPRPPMDHRHLGRTGLLVSPLCLGTMNLGPHADEKESFAILDRALELGIDFVDTANVYGFKPGGGGAQEDRGKTEAILGRWLAQGGGRRERIVLATKVYGRTGDGPNDRGLSARHVKRACEDSLRRLQTDHVDLYQMHHVDRDTPWEETWQAMEQLVSEGKVIYVGSSNFAGWDIATACETAKARHFLGLASEQSIYHLGNRMVELEVLPACRHHGLGVLPWSPLGGGMLAGALEKATEGRRTSEVISKRIAENREKLESYEGLCRELGEEPATVALSWLLHQDGVTAPIIGPRNLEQLEGSLRATEIELDEQALSRLDEIWPGPGGEAPKAYAW